MNLPSRVLIATLCLFWSATVPFAEDKAPEKKEEKKDEAKTTPPADKVTEHAIDLPSGKLSYRVTAGFLPLLLKEDGAKATAQVFHIAYTRQGVEDAAQRPVTFCFNGGPGSSSVWLHLGCFGPKRVWLDEEGNPPSPPGRLVDNVHTLLDQSDLVFVDPVSTGFSRAEKGEDAKAYHGVKGDIEAVGEFIRLYLTRHGRWASPKFLAGESYGTTRAAGLAEHLLDRHGIDLNGLVLVSSVLDFQTLSTQDANLLPYVVYLPTYAATAHYHGKLADKAAADLPALLRRAEAFALDRYLPALARGGALPREDRERIAGELAALTGLKPARILEQNLHLTPAFFMQELLRDEGRLVGRMDGRYTAPRVDAFGRMVGLDPSLAAWMGPYTSALNDYLRRDLGCESDLPYEILSPRVHPWNYDGYENKYVAMQAGLRSVLVRNPNLHIFVASGDLDLATPYFATDFTFRQIALPGVELKWTHRRYPAGHMMYVHQPSLKAMRDDLRAFYDGALLPAALRRVGGGGVSPRGP